ncbi:MAG: bis(5'-nucleosyl)-tetraphosphatase (symmetrical) YqeK [Anaeroplasmataceae bacterium]|nr:bis(5'-nucleosyl)-tetraphosphatase (symmetrical) YqeK [Anaeroplasmataceae bacterium]MDE5868063.1 bis(5'-nucleosyl)-tetraphosphatase (symmetrical) YqeK [Anaeroplasmataceae bacterium]
MHSLAYVKKLVKKKLAEDETRYIHTLGVAKMAKHLALKYNVDVTKAEMAAYMHDYSKNDPKEFQISLLNKQDQLECEKHPVLYHSYAAAELYLKHVGVDKDIYNAIRNHVFGRLGMSKLEEIILISDYTEENRTYPNCIYCRELVLSGKLEEAIYESTKRTIEYIKERGLEPHPLQEEVLNYYKELCK